MKATHIITAAIAVVLLVASGWWYLNRRAPHLIQFPAATAAADSGAFSYERYAAALARYVDDRGMVNYRSLKANSGDLDAFSASLSLVKPGEFDSWGDQQKIAFWINAYNALTLEAIIRNYPIKSSLVRSVVYPKNSIRQIPGVWDQLRFVVAGREMTLNEIEHSALRAKFSEPRIHVALVCAAMSCPPLRNEPYAAENLDQQLDDQARTFLRSSHSLRINRGKATVYLSPIFQWFGEDFIKTYGTSDNFAGKSDTERAVLNFISRYVSEADRDFLLHARYKIEFLDYDWSLNKQKKRLTSEVRRHNNEQSPTGRHYRRIGARILWPRMGAPRPSAGRSHRGAGACQSFRSRRPPRPIARLD